MSVKTNEWLEQYEIKKPDYDYISRDYIGMQDAKFSPARYTLKDGVWTSEAKKEKFSLFKKRSAKPVTVMFAGDITCFDRQIIASETDKGYDFSAEFEKIAPIFAQSDLAVGNLETMVMSEAPYRTEKFVAEQNFHCNAPVEFLDAVRKAGFDVLTNANNHDMDTGAIGIGETIDNVERFGFIQTGTFKTDKKRYEILDVNGIRVAIVAFATEHNHKRCNLTEEGANYLLNDYTEQNAKDIIKDARADGAEVVFVCIHWGKENVTKHNADQTCIAYDLADMGYDCIIGSHPHVLQPYDEITSNGKKVPVFYSMGNFVSHNANNVKARAIIACIELEKSKSGVSLSCSYIPVITAKSCGKKSFVVLPIKEDTHNPRLKSKLDKIKDVMGKKISISNSIEFKEYSEDIDIKIPSLKKSKLDLSKIKTYPTQIDDDKFVYNVYEDHAELVGISKSSDSNSYSLPAKLESLPITKADDSAIENHPTVKKINFRKNIKVVSPKMCKDCKQLEGFQLSDSTKEVGEEAFAGCTSLTAAVMRNKISKIGSRAFADCTNLRTVKLPNNVVEISDDAFDNCPKVTFYCEKNSYGYEFATKHNYNVVEMVLE